VREVSRIRSDDFPCAVSVVIHDLPCLKGDSGGPVVGRDGRLLGMNVVQKGNWTGAKEGMAVLPDRQWLRTLLGGGR
jgi:hypothetical protein